MLIDSCKLLITNTLSHSTHIRVSAHVVGTILDTSGHL